jgi:hypothetical protein
MGDAWDNKQQQQQQQQQGEKRQTSESEGFGEVRSPFRFLKRHVTALLYHDVVSVALW